MTTSLQKTVRLDRTVLLRIREPSDSILTLDKRTNFKTEGGTHWIRSQKERFKYFAENWAHSTKINIFKTKIKICDSY